MDAFAENQMGRDSNVVSSPTPVRYANRPRSRKSSKEEMVPSPDAAEEGLLRADDRSEETDVPGLSVEDSTLIANRWNRKQSTFMPVGDPYAEPDTSTPYATRLANEYCTGSQIFGLLGRLLTFLFPVIKWAPKINRESLKADVIAGLTVGVMLIPQSMSYADIAGLEYKYGLYTSVFPIMVYAMMGSSRQLGVGPVAMVSLLVNVGLKGILTEEECPAYFAQANTTIDIEVMGRRMATESTNEADWFTQAELCPDQYAKLAFLTSLLVGLFQMLAGFCQLGFIVSFLAHPVISGFTSGAAIIIGLSQLQYFVGFGIPKSQYIHETIGHVFSNIHHTKPLQLVLGLSWWFMLSMSRRLANHKKTKKAFGWLKPTAPLITCVLGILIGGNLEYFNGCGFQVCNATLPTKLVVGSIPEGIDSMFSFHLLDFDMFSLQRVLSTAMICSLIGFMESIAIAKSLAAKHKYEVDAGQELIALGVANIFGSVSSGYPITGSFSRSAVNNQVGAQSQLSGFITGCLLLVTLLVLTPLFFFLPKFALAAIVIASVTNLVDYKEFFHLWHVKKQDCLLWVSAFLGTLFLGVLFGLLFAIGLSLVFIIIESVRPQMALLWRLPNTPIYRNIKQESTGQFVNGVIILRIGASMYFANVAFIRDYITRMLSEFSEAADTGPTGARAGLGAAEPASPQDEERASRAAAVITVVPEPVRYIVIEMTPVISIDSTALHMLDDLHRDLKERGIRLAFATVGNRVEDTLKRAGLIDKMGEDWLHPSVHSAVQHCVRHRSRKERSDSNADAVHKTPRTPAGAPATGASVQEVSAVNVTVVEMGSTQ